MNLGEKLTKLRKENKLSQEKLADILGVTRQTLSNWESDITSPDLKQAKKISEIFEVSLDELTGCQNFLEKKILNTEKLAKKQVKFTKVLLLTIYILVLIGLLSLGIYCFTLKDFTKPYQESFLCEHGDEKISISLSGGGNLYYDEEKHEEISTGDIWKVIAISYEGDDKSGIKTEMSAGYSYKDAIESLNYIKKAIVSLGGTCR